MTYNILYGGVGRERLIGEVVGAIQPDIAVFTEVTSATFFESIADTIGAHRAGHDGRRSRAYPVIVSRWPIIQSDLHGPIWARQKWIAATVQPFGGSPVTIHGVQLVSQPLWPFEAWRRQELRFLLKRLKKSPHTSHIVAGDFNALTVGDQQRREGAPAWVRAQWLLQGGKTPRWALSLLTDAGYTDCYRACHPTASGFTVPAWDPSARIDYVFASPDLARTVASSGSPDLSTSGEVMRAVPRRSLGDLLGRKAIKSLGGHASDHLPVWADFRWSAEHGSGYRGNPGMSTRIL